MRGGCSRRTFYSPTCVRVAGAREDSISFPPQCHLSIRHLGAHAIAGGDVGGGADDAALIVEQDGVAAVEGGEGTDGVEGAGGLVESGAAALEYLENGLAQAAFLLRELLRIERQALSRMAGEQAGLGAFETAVAFAHRFAHGNGQSVAQMGQAFAVPHQASLGALGLQPGEQVVGALDQRVQPALLQGGHALAQLVQVAA